MKRIIMSAVLAALMVLPAGAQNFGLDEKSQQPNTTPPQALPAPPESVNGLTALPVKVPMLCGPAKAIQDLLKEWKVNDVMIGANPITENTIIIFHFDGQGAKMVITQWDMDMSGGCVAFIADHTKINREGLKAMDPSY